MRDAQEAGDGGVPAGLLHHACTGVDQDDREFGRGGSGDHVAGVLHVAGGAGEDEAPGSGGEVAVGDIDGDALFALGTQAVREQRQVQALLSAAPRCALNGAELVGEDRFGIVQQPADQRGLALVHASGGGQAQK